MYILKNLDHQTTNAIRADWIEQVQEGDDSALEITDSFFDYLMNGNFFGELFQRSNQITYMAVADQASNSIIAITEIVFSRQGSRSICKIMDIVHAPAIGALEDDQYLDIKFDTFISILSYMLEINKLTKHGITKIYARDGAAQKTITQIHEDADEKSFRDLGFEMRLSGHRWLEFKKI